MIAARLREALRARPFVPIRVGLDDNNAIVIANPRLAAVSATGRCAYIFDPSGDGGRSIDISRIAFIEPWSPNAEPKQ